jgi:hypothetical protein
MKLVLYYVKPEGHWNGVTGSNKRLKILTQIQIGHFVVDRVDVPKKLASSVTLTRDVSGGSTAGCRRLSS